MLIKRGEIMRYIYYIFIIFFAISAIIGFELKGKHGTVKEENTQN
jgi:hypothetical protein